jgi:hypothetical protein
MYQNTNPLLNQSTLTQSYSPLRQIPKSPLRESQGTVSNQMNRSDINREKEEFIDEKYKRAR